jgi:hypothetical protein
MRREVWADFPEEIAVESYENRDDDDGTSEWIHLTMDLYYETYFSFKQSKMIALIESDRYTDRQLIADIMDVSPEAIADHKKRIQSTIEYLNKIQETSDHF